jgi:hypothetical protein
MQPSLIRRPRAHRPVRLHGSVVDAHAERAAIARALVIADEPTA